MGLRLLLVGLMVSGSLMLGASVLLSVMALVEKYRPSGKF
jgi:hypothetical protein